MTAGLHRVQAAQLQHHEEQEEQPRSSRDEEVLPLLQEAHRSSRNQVRKADNIMADKTEKKPGFVARMKAAVKGFAANAAKFFRDTKSELKKVVWPSKADIKTNTVVVLVTVAIAAVVMIALDAIFGGILGLIIGA